MENLLDINFTLFGPDNRSGDRLNLYLCAAEIGDLAWTSESQFYLLCAFNAFEVQDCLREMLRPADFLKIQTVSGLFSVTGYFPPTVNALLELAHSKGLISLALSRRANPIAARKLLSPSLLQ